MRRTRWVWSLAAAALVAAGGCSDLGQAGPPGAATDPASPQPPSGCNADRIANVVGLMPTPELLEAARLGAGAAEVRSLAHDAPVSSNYRAGQLNLVLDIEGRVGSVNCG